MFRSNLGYTTTWQRRLNRISDATIRSRILLSMMETAGCIERYTGGGEFLEFPIRMTEPKPAPYQDYRAPEYSQPDTIRMGKLNWAAYQHGNHLGRLLLSRNMGRERFISIFDEAMKEVERAFKGRWCQYLYQDANTAEENDPMVGFYSVGNLASASTAAADQGFEGKFRLCSGTYAGLTVDLGDQSTEWEGDDGEATVQSGTFAGYHWWPHGQGDPAYDYTHPVIVNTTAGAAAGSPEVWGPNADFNPLYCESMLDTGIVFSRRVQGGEGEGLNLILCAAKPILTIKERFASTYRTVTVQTNAINGQTSAGRPGQAIETGFKVHMHGGCVLAEDFDMPSSTDLIGLRIMDVKYHPVTPYDGKGSTTIMTPFRGQVEGGGGELIGGFSYGQLAFERPRGLVFWRRLG